MTNAIDVTPAPGTLRRILRTIPALALAIGLSGPTLAQDYDIEMPDMPPPAPPVSGGATLFRDVRIFDGMSPTLSQPSNVLMRDNVIERISTSPISADVGARVIAGGGRVPTGIRSWRRRPGLS